MPDEDVSPSNAAQPEDSGAPEISPESRAPEAAPEASATPAETPETLTPEPAADAGATPLDAAEAAAGGAPPVETAAASAEDGANTLSQAELEALTAQLGGVADEFKNSIAQSEVDALEQSVAALQSAAPAPRPAPAPPPPAAEPPAPAVMNSQVTVNPADAAPFAAPELDTIAAGATTSIDLLDDVELDVKIELGRAQLYIEDVLRLGPGAVVELDKLAGDPVDIFVNERLIARGEVLVLNDNFCVRINDIKSPVPELDAG